MSIKVMTDVWASKLYSSGTLLVLLAMADWANDEDLTCRPSVSALAKKARLTDRQVQRVLRKLEADGTITAVGTYPTRTGSPIAIYRINTDTLNGKGVKMSPFSATGKGDIGNARRVTLATAKGDIGDTERVTLVSPDPLLGDPLLEPSLGEGEAAVPPAPPQPPTPVDVVDDSEQTRSEPTVAATAPTQSPAGTVGQALDGATQPAAPASTTRAIVEQPAIAVYHDVFLAVPSRALMAQILKHQVADLDRWRAAVTAWCLAGYNPRNVGGMLDWYDHPDRIPTNGPPAARSNGSPPGMSKVEKSLAAVDEVMAMLEKGGTL